MSAYISEFNIFGGSTEFVEVAVPSGTNTANWSLVVYNGDGSIAATLSLGGVDASIAGRDLYVIRPTDGLPNLGYTHALALADGSGTAVQFISWHGTVVTPATGPAAGMTSTDIGSTDFGNSFETADGGASYFQQTSPNPGTIPCFGAGTLIETPDGPRPIESLSAGDRVLTATGATEPIRWACRREICFETTPHVPRPIRIAAHALGPGRPATDLIVSVQHRIALGVFGQLEALFPQPVLVPARALLPLRGVRAMNGRPRVTWHHLMLDRHELLIANGCVAESLFLGPLILRDLWQGSRRRLAERLDDPVPALPLMRVGAARDRIVADRARGSCGMARLPV
ncbi:Hint domain-containing protein [Rhodovulum tesquicola]|uniref:Hint domain-containing protein n=1 Tax=Rhodovulum tesquicola TaxID=540254 RepID=UPI002096BC40|nr:Hint domain-containing protein [Rhodovulum tesquicola]MCO8144377.1 Hint domain-containing protein [Rhodovulum tesquicola]